MNQEAMRQKPIFPLVLTMSLPMVLSMLVNALYNIVDSYFVAKISQDAMTAISLVYPLQNMVNAIGVGFGIGINAAVSFFLGARQQREAEHTAALGLILAVVHGLVLTGLCYAVVPAFLRLFTSEQAVLRYGWNYSWVVFAFSTILIVSVTYEKIFQAAGKMTVSMISLMAGCIGNIILDPIMIFGWGPVPAMGMEGAALATGLGQLLSLLVYLAVYAAKKLPLRLSFSGLSRSGALARRLYAVGIPAALNIALPSLQITILNAILAGFGQMYVLILGIYYKLQTFIYLTANGVVQGIRPLVGYNYGAGEYGRIKKIFAAALGITMAVMLLGTGLCMAIPEQLMRLYADNPDTISAGAQALRLISIGFAVSAVSVTASGTLEGMSRGLPSLLVSLLRYVVVLTPLAFLLSRLLGVVGVWHAFWLTEIVAAMVAYTLYLRSIRRAVRCGV